MNDDAMIAVDPHKASDTSAVLNPVTKTVIEAARFANSVAGYALLSAFAGGGAADGERSRDAMARADRWHSFKPHNERKPR